MNEADERVTGTVLLVQEHRFRLLRPDGGQVLCELGPAVPVGPADLRRIVAENATVELMLAASPGTRARRVRKLWRILPPSVQG